MTYDIVDRYKRSGMILSFFLLFAGFLLAASNANAESGFFTTSCAPCHASPTPSTCNGCHAHGTHASSAKTGINVAAVTNKSTYAPGETISVTITGGYRTGWIRAILYNESGVEVKRSTGTATGGMGGGAGYPITLTGTAPAVGGTYTFTASWYGNKYDKAERGGTTSFGPNWTPDPNNPNHGEEKVSTNSFTVSAATVAGPLSVSPAGGLSSSGTAGGPFSPSSQSYTLTNTGTAPMNWTASKAQSWVTLSSTGGTLAAGATATVTASINSGANSLAAGSYSDTVTFANTTNGTGNTTRAVGLTVNAAVSLSGIAISGPASVNESATGTFAVTATWSDGTTTSVTPAWTTTLGTISASGVLTAPSVTANQTATVSASYTFGGVTRTASRSVTIANVQAALSGIAISGPASVNESATGTFAVTATWSDGTTTSVTPAWTTTLGTISASGVLTAPSVTANQTATVSASYTFGGVTRTASRSVTIANVQAALSGIAISGPASVNESATGTFAVTATWSDGTTTSVTPAWTTTLGTISASGVLTAPSVTANQTATVSASYTFGGVTRTATMAVTVVDVAQQAGALKVMPEDNAVDVPVNAVITVRNGGTAGIDTIFNRNTFTLKPEASTPDSSIAPSEPYRGSVCVSDGIVQGSFRYNWDRTRGTFIPNCPLVRDTTYAGTVTTAAGSSLAAPFEWRFTTIAASPDSDDDGSSDDEDDHPRDDRRTSLWTPHWTGKISVDTTDSSGTTIRSAMAISDGSARLNQDGSPEGYEFLDGMVSLRAEGVASGSNAKVTITFPSVIPPGSKVYQADSNGFHEVPTAIVHGNTVTMTIPGGNPSGNADLDNGVLIDPVGVASPATPDSGSIDLTSSSSGGGCSIAGRNGSGGSNIDAFLILAGLGVIAWRSRVKRSRS